MSTTETFLHAIATGDVGQVDALLEGEPALARASTADGISAVLWAAYHRQQDVVGRLIATGMDLDIFEAAAVGDLGRTRDLLSEGSTVANAHSADGFAPLGLAAFFGHLDVLLLLLACGADPNAPSLNGMRVAPLHSAAAHGEPEASLRMSRELLLFGADPNLRQHGGWTPLHQAAAQGREELVDLLLKHGADPSARSADDMTPEQKAAEGGHARLAERLRQQVVTGPRA